MKRLLLLVVFFCLCAGLLNAQQTKRSNYKLLWKISGNGLRESSYLFGTMHVYDNRAFDFSDSVLLKISECKAFALETHPDSAMKYVITAMFQNLQQKNKFKELLSEKEYARMDSLLAKKTGYTLDKLKSPMFAEILLQRKKIRKDRTTFVDAYLYNIARKQNKLILGLEDFEEQFPLLEEESSKNIKEKLNAFLDSDSSHSVTPYTTMTTMLTLYYNGDIDALRDYLKDAYHTNPAGYEKLITNRNVGMAQNIEKEIHAHSTFIAVGVGHLPGEEGLINLLQKRGYKVTLVPPSFKGLAKKYTYESEPEKWFSFVSKEGGYSVEMPSKPVPLKIDSLALTFQIGIDIGTNLVYQTTFISANNMFDGMASKEVFDKLESNYRKSKSKKTEGSRDFTINGLPAREFIVNADANIFKVLLILRGDIMYMLMVGPTREAINSADAQKFLKSFKSFEFIQESWKDFTDAEGAFGIKMNGEVKKQDINTDDPGTGQVYHIKLYMSLNPQKQETYLLRYNDFPLGYVSHNDSLYYASITDGLVSQMQGVDLVKKEVLIDGFNGYEFRFEIGKQAWVKGRAVLRGNRFYLLMTTSSKLSKATVVDDFLNSFRFLDYQPSLLKERVFVKEGFKVKLPLEIQIDSSGLESDNRRVVYNTLDSNTGIPYIVVTEQFSDYDQFESKEDFFASENKALIFDSDSVIDSRYVTTKEYIAQDIVVVSKVTNTTKNVRTILNGKQTYQLVTYLPVDFPKPAIDEFYNSFQLTSKSSWDLFSDKTDLLLRDITSADTVIQQAAISALDKHDFQQSDLPGIYRALAINYGDDDQTYSGVRHKLFQRLKELKDPASIAFIRKFYIELPDSSELRSRVLSVLSGLKTEAATTELIKLVNEGKRYDFNSYLILHPYYDSLQLVSSIALHFTSFESKFEDPSGLFNLTQALLDSGLLSENVSKSLVESLMKIGKERTSTPVKVNKSDTNYYQESEYWKAFAALLNFIPFTNDVERMVRTIHQSGDAGIMIVTSKTLLNHDVKISVADLEKIASDPLLRLEAYDMLKSINKEKLFPAKFSTVQKLSESALIEYMNYEDGAPDRIELVATKLVKYDDQQQRLFIYKYKYATDPEWYIGFSGPYPVKSKDIVVRGDLTFNTYNVYVKSKLNEVVRAELKDYTIEFMD